MGGQRHGAEPAINSAAEEKAPTSKRSCPATGTPIWSISRKCGQPVRRGAQPGQHGVNARLAPQPTPEQQHTKAAREQVEQPEPVKPSAGAPRWPKISTQLKKAFSPTLKNRMIIGCHGRPSASLNCRKTWKRKVGMSDTAMMTKTGSPPPPPRPADRNGATARQPGQQESQTHAHRQRDRETVPQPASAFLGPAAPCARATNTETGASSPMPRRKRCRKRSRQTPRPPAARGPHDPPSRCR